MGLLLGGAREQRQAFPEPVIPPYRGADIYGNVGAASDPDTALAIPTVWACVSRLANAVGMLPLETFRRTDTIPKRIPDPPFVLNPSAEVTQSEWLQSVMVSLLLRGNCYGLVTARDPFGRPTQIDLLHPDKLTVKVDKDNGQVTYYLNSPGGLIDLPTHDVWHVRGMTMPGAKVGLSVLSYAAQAMGVDIASRKFATEYFTGGGIPKAILTSDQNINQQQSQTIKEKWLAASRSREVMVMGAGLGYHAIQVSPEESQFLATQQFGVAQIARFFSIAPELVGGSSGNSNTYANVEQRGIEFLTYAVGFWLKRLEDALFPCFAQPTYVKFNIAALLRTDAETQAKVRNQQIAGKYRTPTEIRAQDDLPPMTPEQLDEVNMVPLTVTPLGGVKALPGLKEPEGPASVDPAGDKQGDPNAA